MAKIAQLVERMLARARKVTLQEIAEADRRLSASLDDAGIGELGPLPPEKDEDCRPQIFHPRHHR